MEGVEGLEGVDVVHGSRKARIVQSLRDALLLLGQPLSTCYWPNCAG